MDKILDILKLKKIDKFLLLHYPIIWKFQLLYLLPFLIGYSIFLYLIPFDFIMDKWSFSLLFILFIMPIMFIYRFNNSFMQKIKLSGFKEYFLYLIIYIVMTMPFVITFQANKYFFDKNKQVYNENYYINNFKIEDNMCLYKVTKDKTRALDKEEKKFITIVIQAFSDKNISKLSEEDFNTIIDNYNKVALFGIMKNSFEIWIIVLLLLPFITIFSIFIYNQPTIIMVLIIYMGIGLVGIINLDSLFIKESIKYLHEVNILGVGILFLIATIFTYLYKVKLNYITAWLVLLGLVLYFFILTFYIHLGILYSGLLIVLNMLFIISSFKEKLIILDARPRK